jgi:hypothetical protein
MTSKKIAGLVLVGFVLALSIGIILAPDVSEGSVIIPAVKNASVSPPVGNYTDSFNYTVDVRFYDDTRIELQIHHPIEDKFKSYGERKYNGSRDWQTLWWNGTTFGPAWEGEDVKYLFSWNGTELLFAVGPHIKEEPRWELTNATVTPISGYYNYNFTYSVDVKVNKEEEIFLEVFNISNYKWEGRGQKQYNDRGNWQLMKWDNITDIASADSEGLASYRFFFIESGERYESQIYYNPTLKPIIPEEGEIFKNAAVDPSSGYNNTPFSYGVEANAGEDVVLTVYDISIGEWVEKGIGTKIGDTWEWANIQFNKDCAGLASYKFVAGTHESGIFYGPTLNKKTTSSTGGGGGGGGGGSSYKPYIQYENAIVDPSWVVIGVREVKSFNYTVDVDRDVTALILEIYNASSKEWEEKGGIGEESRLKDGWQHEWRVNLTLDKNWEGTSKYRFYPTKQEKYASQVFYGPEIKTTEASLAGWKKEMGVAEKALKEPELIRATVTPTKDYWFKKFTYSAEIKHPDRANMTVVLYVYKPGSKEWKPVPWRGYRYNPIIRSSDYDESDTVNVSWTVEKKEVFDEGDAGKSSQFYFWYWDGYNEYNESKGSFDGPMLLANEAPEFVRAVTPSPEYGSTHTVYTYTFEVNDPENDAVYGWLTITDPLTEEHVIEGTGEEGVIKFIVGPGLGIFTEDKLRGYINETNEALFTSRYRLEYWDDCMAVKDEKPKNTTWFEGPHVSLIRIEPKMEPPDPVSGKYADEFEYHVGFYSSKDNTFWLDLTIYDPSNPEHGHQTLRTKRLRVSADSTNYTSWKVKPEVFGPGDFGKTACYAIAWKDEVGNRGVLKGSGPYIERAVPLLSWDLPLVPIISMVIAPLIVIGISLLSVLSGVPVSSLLRRRLGELRKGREKGAEKKKEEEG